MAVQSPPPPPPPIEILRSGLQALHRDLGADGLARFLQFFENGEGDYTAERHTWLGDESIESIVEQIQQFKSKSG